jgi:hypothetical protein
MTSGSASVTFETTVTANGNNTGIVVPDEAIEKLAAGKRPPVLVNLNGYEYRNTVGVMAGRHMVSISAAVRKATGLKGGDPVHVTLTVADTPREVEVPADFATALAADDRARAFFGNCPTACSGTTSTTSTPPRAPRRDSGASTRRSPWDIHAVSQWKSSAGLRAGASQRR